MLIELRENEVEVICAALQHRSKQLRLEWSVSGDDNTLQASEQLSLVAKEMMDQFRKNQVRNFFPGI